MCLGQIFQELPQAVVNVLGKILQDQNPSKEKYNFFNVPANFCEKLPQAAINAPGII